MKYLPILQELFESDTIIFLIIGIAISVIIGLRLRKNKCLIGAAISIAIYAVCEFTSNIHTNFMLEFIQLFIGTFAIGCCIGFILCFLIKTLLTHSAHTVVEN